VREVVAHETVTVVPRTATSLQYVSSLEGLAQGDGPLGSVEWRQRLVACLDGEPADVLRSQEDRSLLKEQGAYFTSTKMARKLATKVSVTSDSQGLYFDPACGAGDLLLGVAKRLPIAPTLQETILDWSKRLAGWDISPDFVRMAKARLVLLAASRCRVRPSSQGIALDSVFPRISARDFFSRSMPLQPDDVVVMNPPFSYIPTPYNCDWSSGQVNAAAVFTEKVVRDAPAGLRVVAILPEVLRSGTRYDRWRRVLSSLARIRSQRTLGQFDKWTDVDVYLLDLVRASSESVHGGNEALSAGRARGGVGRRFSVHVGPVVPHRHKKTGPDVRFIHARSVPAWGECKELGETRRFNGRLFLPPFVVVRRTSRPGDAKRAVASLILGDAPVAIENHLIVLVPRDASAATCKELMWRLASRKTDAWLDKRIRCRHLTTRVLSTLPWWDSP